MKFKGKVIAITKVKNDEGMAFRITTDNGVYLEIANIKDEGTFNTLTKSIDLGKRIEIIIKED